MNSENVGNISLLQKSSWLCFSWRFSWYGWEIQTFGTRLRAEKSQWILLTLMPS